MPNTKFRAGGKTYKHNIPNEKIFGGKRYYLSFAGSKRDCEAIAKEYKNRKGTGFFRIVKTPRGYEDANKKPYGFYLRLPNWKD
jgi:hypothetical protein